MSKLDYPNVIWVFGDQHRAQALGYMGNPNVNTPNIDGLAQTGSRFPTPSPAARGARPFVARC